VLEVRRHDRSSSCRASASRGGAPRDGLTEGTTVGQDALEGVLHDGFEGGSGVEALADGLKGVEVDAREEGRKRGMETNKYNEGARAPLVILLVCLSYIYT